MIELYYFSFSFIELIAFGIASVAFLYQLYFYIRFMNGVLRLRSKTNKNKISFLTDQPPVSVIICAKDEEDNLRQYLPLILNQEYPDFEVIVINDGSTDETETLLNNLCVEYPNLRTTFVPVGARNLSTKKLGLTLGIKAAKNELMLFTDADCMPEDTKWIAQMARNFSPQTDFILGYGAYLNKKGFVNRLITYDTLFIALQYMGMAISGKPYMGVGRNLAYRKETFFLNKGFASNLNLISGDDDLFVNKASNAKNTKVEISPESITWSEPNKTLKGWFFQKERHLSVSSYYKFSSKFRLSLEPLTRGLFYSALILSVVFGNIVTLIASAVLLIIRLLVQLIIINKSSRHFGERRYFLLMPVFDIFLPLINLYILTIGRITSGGKTVRWK